MDRDNSDTNHPLWTYDEAQLCADGPSHTTHEVADGVCGSDIEYSQSRTIYEVADGVDDSDIEYRTPEEGEAPSQSKSAGIWGGLEDKLSKRDKKGKKNEGVTGMMERPSPSRGGSVGSMVSKADLLPLQDRSADEDIQCINLHLDT